MFTENTIILGGRALLVKISGLDTSIKIPLKNIFYNYSEQDINNITELRITKVVEMAGGKNLLISLNNGYQTVIYSSVFKGKVKPELLIMNIGQLLTMDDDDNFGLIENAAILVGKGQILDVGTEEQIFSRLNHSINVRIIDAKGQVVSPGLIDAHTHPVFSGNRSEEFALRTAGISYEEIQKRGGGINSTVESTRNTDEFELEKIVTQRISKSVVYGVTAIEAKSGYALNMEGELKSLRVLRNISNVFPLDISPTLLAAHIVSKEYKNNREDYIKLILNAILPVVKYENLVYSCDVFCEKSAFSLEETEIILKKAVELGLKTRIHAGQFNSLGAVSLGAKLGSLSVDHLENLTQQEFEDLSQSHTIATLLPGAALMLGMKLPDSREFLNRNIKVAIATDMNPGTSMTNNLPLMATLACTQMNMSTEDAWRGITSNAALAAGFMKKGKLVKGYDADFVIWNFDHYGMLPYYYGEKLASRIFKSGKELIFSK